MHIRPCPADRARALVRLRKGPAARFARKSEQVIEVELGCGCIMVVDFNDRDLATALEKSIRNKLHNN
jgi:hypothetical protein